MHLSAAAALPVGTRLREQITQVTNRNEAFHGFADWLIIKTQSSLRSLQAVHAQDLGFPRFGGAGFTIEEISCAQQSGRWHRDVVPWCFFVLGSGDYRAGD